MITGLGASSGHNPAGYAPRRRFMLG